MSPRIIIASILLILAYMLQFHAGHIAPDFVLGALLAFAVALPFSELLAAVIASLWVMSWQPIVSVELAWFAVIPLGAALIAHRLPLAPWAAFATVLLGGIMAFYVFIDPWFITRNPALFFRVLLGSVIFAGCVFELLRPVRQGGQQTLI